MEKKQSLIVCIYKYTQVSWISHKKYLCESVILFVSPLLGNIFFLLSFFYCFYWSNKTAFSEREQRASQQQQCNTLNNTMKFMNLHRHGAHKLMQWILIKNQFCLQWHWKWCTRTHLHVCIYLCKGECKHLNFDIVFKCEMENRGETHLHNQKHRHTHTHTHRRTNLCRLPYCVSSAMVFKIVQDTIENKCDRITHQNILVNNISWLWIKSETSCHNEFE